MKIVAFGGYFNHIFQCLGRLTLSVQEIIKQKQGNEVAHHHKAVVSYSAELQTDPWFLFITDSFGDLGERAGGLSLCAILKDFHIAWRD